MGERNRRGRDAPKIGGWRPSTLGAAAGTAGPRGAWTSGLSTGDFACLRTAGFRPVGQVMGNAVLNFAWWHEEVGPHRRLRPPYPRELNGLTLRPRMRAYADLLYQGRRTSIERMAAECAALGGDGVVAVGTRVMPYPGDKRARQFTALGTAVRAAGEIRAPAPFTAHLTAQDFTQLIMAGWVPASIAVGIGVSERKWSAGAAPRRLGDDNRELRAWTDAIATARAQARDRMRADASRAGGEEIVLATADHTAGVHTFGPRGMGGGYCIVEATFIGTVVAAFRPSRPQPRPVAVTGLADGSGRKGCPPRASFGRGITPSSRRLLLP
jgi:uncharacterized protein YbjQ (UPF0145 family)